MHEIITALVPTVLKKDYRVSSKLLSSDRKLSVPEGKVYQVTRCEERGAGTDMGGHFQVDISHGAGTWYIFGEHWRLPWQGEPDSENLLITPDAVDWNDWRSPVSKYFTVGEVTLRQRDRIPQSLEVKKNVLRVAREMDVIRDWWGSPLGVNSWYRPWSVNSRIGSRAPNHPSGTGVDFRPLNGSIHELQKRFEREWYDKGLWSGGFGRGAGRGFIHVDLRHKRAWNY